MRYVATDDENAATLQLENYLVLSNFLGERTKPPVPKEQTMEKMQLPKGIQSFRKIREGGYYYVDKTAHIDRLVRDGSNCFVLSRPRRFGKSLFVTTLREAFEGNEELFRGLALHDKWDWSTQYPVIHLSFGSGRYHKPDGLIRSVEKKLHSVEKKAGLLSNEPDPSVRLFELIENLCEMTGKEVVILVDEYDKPILDALNNTEVANANCDDLSAIYGAVKDASEMVHFSFFTGVTRFAKTSLYSGMNNFDDITLKPKFSLLCGYTEAEVRECFAPEIDGLDWEKVREWYNGYNWLGDEKVYNPYDIMLYLESRKFHPWWFNTGAPGTLFNLLEKRNVMSVELDRPLAQNELLESFDIDRVDTKALLFQSGYLTITDEIELETDDIVYRLDYPNREVRQHLNRYFLRTLAPNVSQDMIMEHEDLHRKMAACDDKALEVLLQRLLAGLPRQWHAPVDIAKYESYIASSLYSYFTGAGYTVRAEDATNRGRIDLVVIGSTYNYIFEIKMVDGEGTGGAFGQIGDMEYYQKYRGTGKPLYLAEVEISKSSHNIVKFDVVEDDGGK